MLKATNEVLAKQVLDKDEKLTKHANRLVGLAMEKCSLE